MKILRGNACDVSQVRIVAEVRTMAEAMDYLERNTVDGTNVSWEDECDYLWIDKGCD